MLTGFPGAVLTLNSMAPTYTNSVISSYYFSSVLDAFDEEVEGMYRCRCGTVRRQAPRSGFSNLMSHIRDQHPDHLQVIHEADTGAGTLASWVRKGAKTMHGWLDWIITSNLPLHFCEKLTTRRYTLLDPVCAESVRSAMEKVTVAVEAKIKAELPNHFGLVMDGWSHDSEHFLAVFACYEIDGIGHYPLLAMAPLLNEDGDDHSSEAHRLFLNNMLTRDYGKSMSDCLFIVADNCCVNRKLATITKIPLVGCASHRLNLAVQEHLKLYEDELDTLQNLMRKLRTLNLAAKLRSKTTLRPVVRQDTRWSSTYCMVDRYFRLAEFLLDDEELCDLLPTPRAVKRLRRLLEELKRIESVSKSLQCETTTIRDVRRWFDGLIEVEPSFSKYLAPRAKIVHSPEFEMGCTKALNGESTSLTKGDAAALVPFAIEDAEEESDAETTSFVMLLERKRRRAQRERRYTLLQRIPPTSNMVERFFSLARITFGHERHSLNPYTLKMILFLRVNRAYWDVRTVNECV